MRVIDRVARPALILSAEDDPFVPPDDLQKAGSRRQPAHHDADHASTAATAPSSVKPNGYDGYWAERQVVEFIAQTHGTWRELAIDL